MNEWGNNPATYQAIGAVISSIGIIAVFFSTILAWKSLGESKAQRKNIEREFAARMRPWIGLFGCDFHFNDQGVNGIDELQLLIKNFGTLPAQNANLKIILEPLINKENEPKNPIIKLETGSKVLLPSEEGKYRINLSEFPQFEAWKNERRNLRLEGVYLYSLNNIPFSSKFESILRFGIPTSDKKPFKLNWRNQEVN